jgi:tetratricopeptide (TPR) repeat protein
VTLALTSACGPSRTAAPGRDPRPRPARIPRVTPPPAAAALPAALADLRAGRGPRGVVVTGAPGAGKTHLLRALAAHVDGDPAVFVVLRLRASAETRREPAHLLGRAVRTSAAIPDDAPASEARAALAAWCARRLPRAPDAVELVGELVALPSGAGQHEPDEVHRRATALLRADVYARAAEAPVVVTIDDAHHADAPSLAFFTSLVDEAPPGTPVLVVLAGRAELAERLGERAGAAWAAYAVPPVSDDALTALAGDRELAAAAGGNPQLALELAAARAEGISPLPATLEDVVRARVQRFPTDARVVAQLGGVVGRVFWLDAVAALLDEETLTGWPASDDLEGAVAHLVRAGWVEPAPSAFAGTSALSFVSDGVREIVRDLLPARLRSRLHGHVFRWLQARVGDRELEWLAALGGHLEAAGGAPLETADLYQRAARRAAATNAVREALQLHARAVAVGGVPAGARAALRLEAARLRERVGDWERVHRELLRAQDEARSVGDQGLVARCLALDASVTLLEGQFERATTLARRGLATARKAGAPDAEADALTVLATVAARQGRWAEAAAAREEALALRIAAGDRAGEAAALLGLGQSRNQAGDVEAAVAAWRRAADLFRELGDLAGAGTALHHLGYAAHHAGRYREAIAVYEESLALRRAAGDRPRTAWNLHNLSHLHRALGDHDRALALHLEEIATSRAVGNRPGVGYGLFTQGALEEHRGDLEAARRSYEASLAVFREVEEWPQVGAQLVCLASLAHARGDREGALALLDEAAGHALDDEQQDEALQCRALVELDHGTPEAADAALAALAAHQERTRAPKTAVAWRRLHEARAALARGAADADERLQEAVAAAEGVEDVRPRAWARALQEDLRGGRSAAQLLAAAEDLARTGSARLRSRSGLHLARALVAAAATPEQARAALALRPPAGDAAVAAAWDEVDRALRALAGEGA